MIGVALPQPVAQVSESLRGLQVPWAICGGWAIDLWLDRPVREHADVDVAVFREDQHLAP